MAALVQNMRMIAVYHKGKNLKNISHLDVQRTLQRAFRRACLPLLFSNGFNPHPQLSFASALATGTSSDAEWFDVELAENMEPQRFIDCVNVVMPEGFWLSDAFIAPDGFGSLSSKTRAALYDVHVAFDRPISGQTMEDSIEALLSGEIMINKRTKGGMKSVDLRPQIQKVSVTGIEGTMCSLRVLGRLQADGGLRVEHLLDVLSDRLDAQYTADVHRVALYFADDGLLPRLPQD